MGQRSQIYIRYGKNSERLVAYHLQWNWGSYMINRTYQLLDFIKANVEDRQYSCFFRDYGYSTAQNMLESLIQLNTTIKSYVNGINLVKEQYKYFNEDNKDTFKIDPRFQDNNDGILVIDIKEDGIKYGLSLGWWDDDIQMINARDYYKHYRQAELDYFNEHRERYSQEDINEQEKILNQTLEQTICIDRDPYFTLLSQEDFEEIFNKEYFFKDNGYIEVKPLF